MGGCLSTTGYTLVVTEADVALHKEAEKLLKEASARLASQTKVLLLGSGDSGKSTVLKQMRLIHSVPFTPQEIETYRQLIFMNLTNGMGAVLEAMIDMHLTVSEDNLPHSELILKAMDEGTDIREGQPYPQEYLHPLEELWKDEMVQHAVARGNEAAIPENLSYFFPSLQRLFAAGYKPTEQDVIYCRARTTGILETVFKVKDQRGSETELLMVDVGGQKSERRKWIHCFQDVTCILFLVNLSGYDQCIVEDKTANQMQDSMTIWDSICNSQWFKRTSIVLFLNKNDLFEKKIHNSDIRKHFAEYSGETDPAVGRKFFQKRFWDLAHRSGTKDREVFVHVTTATNTRAIKIVMRAVEGKLEPMSCLVHDG
ncbi:guanine nucleotide-binding protein alpha-2 subunit [Pleurotus eryngii]|uniref:Guanine nucleotide-binding protein alpha-2 subunit n=1 Tax=Pleurotus eryngii TaxID=5323 RepID=A0A9P5ZTP2_PLEER|nr:guanine nucleotide-binding protein alpha-2 subunit [Pleurotus eryngii]